MSVLDTLKEQKVHIFYLVTIFIICGVGYTLFSHKPSEVIQTVSKVKDVAKNIVTKDHKVIHKTIVQKNVDGSSITTTESIEDGKIISDKSKIDTTFTSKTDTKYLSKYTLGAFYTLPKDLRTLGTFQPYNFTLVGGIRLFDSPMFFNIGTNMTLNLFTIGVTLEL